MQFSLVVSLIFALVSNAAFAFDSVRVDPRDAQQERRIEHGAKHGRLTQEELQRLERREARIEADKAAAKQDGVVTRKESLTLRHEENRNSRAIYRQKHDRQHRH